MPSDVKMSKELQPEDIELRKWLRRPECRQTNEERKTYSKQANVEFRTSHVARIFHSQTVLIRVFEFYLLSRYFQDNNRPFSYSAKESRSSVIFVHFYTQASTEWR